MVYPVLKLDNLVVSHQVKASSMLMRVFLSSSINSSPYEISKFYIEITVLNIMTSEIVIPENCDLWTSFWERFFGRLEASKWMQFLLNSLSIFWLSKPFYFFLFIKVKKNENFAKKKLKYFKRTWICHSFQYFAQRFLRCRLRNFIYKLWYLFGE